MRSRQQVSRAGLELIKRFEGYRQKAAMLPDGRWTIGFGHTKTARPGAEVSPADAEALLIYDLMEVTQTLSELVYTPLNQNQFDALAAFVFNVGRESFQQSAVLKRINEGALLQAACAFDLWRRAAFEGESIVIDALVRRRAAEKALFLTPPGGFVPAPTPLLQPQIDYDMSGTIPRQTPVEVIPSMEGETVVAERVEPEASASAPAPAQPEAPGQASAGEQPAPAPVEPPAPVAPPADNVLTLTPPPEQVEPERSPEPEHGQAPFTDFPQAANDEPEPELFFPEGEPAVIAERSVFDLSARETMGEPFGDEDEFGDVEPAEGSSKLMAYLGLAALGIAVFAGGLFIGFNGAASGDQGLFSVRNFGIGLGVVGIVCTAFAVYFLLDRLGGRGEPESE